MGISQNDYGAIQVQNGLMELAGPHGGTGNAISVAAGRLAYFFGLQVHF